jgi:hypothetical protein
VLCYKESEARSALYIQEASHVITPPDLSPSSLLHHYSSPLSCSFTLVYNRIRLIITLEFLNRDFKFNIKSLLLNIINTCSYACVIMYISKLLYNLLRLVAFALIFNVSLAYISATNWPKRRRLIN